MNFERLDAGATHTEEVVLDVPFKDNMRKRPWGEWQDTKLIDIENIQQVVAKVWRSARRPRCACGID